MWLSQEDSVELQLGFYSSDTGGTTVFEVFSLDLRYANVFKRDANLDLYWGASVGYLNVTDQTVGRSVVEETGTSARLFLGVELFFVSLPNLGISSEIGVGTQSVGENNVTNISTTTFPAFSIRYYF